MANEPITFEYRIETRRGRFGGWTYTIKLSEDKSRASRRFHTQEAALRDAHELLSYMR